MKTMNTPVTIEANPILGATTMRIVAEQGTERVSFNIDFYSYTQIARTLIRCGNLEVVKNLILDNGGSFHREPNLDISRL